MVPKTREQPEYHTPAVLLPSFLAVFTLDLFTRGSKQRHIADSEHLGLEAQWALKRSFKGLLAVTTGPNGLACSLTAFSEAYQRHEPAPELSEPEWEAVRSYLLPAVDALIREALARSGAAREELWR